MPLTRVIIELILPLLVKLLLEFLISQLILLVLYLSLKGWWKQLVKLAQLSRVCFLNTQFPPFLDLLFEGFARIAWFYLEVSCQFAFSDSVWHYHHYLANLEVNSHFFEGFEHLFADLRPKLLRNIL